MPLRFDGPELLPAGRRFRRLATGLGGHLGDVKIAIGAVWNHRLAGLETHLRAIEMDGYDVRFEGHKTGDAADFVIGVGVGPSRLACISNGVIAAETLVRTEGLKLHRSEGRLVDIGTWNVPAGCKAGFVKHQRPLRIGDDPTLMVDHEVTRGLADVDAVIGIGGVTHDAFVLLVECIHGSPSERDQTVQIARMGGQVGMLPGSSRRDMLLVGSNAVPGRRPEVGVLSDVLGAFQHMWGNIGLREIGHRITARFEQQEDLLAVGNPVSPEVHAHAAA